MNPAIFTLETSRDQGADVADLSTTESTRQALTTSGVQQSPVQDRYGNQPAVIARDVSASEHQIEHPRKTRNLRLLDRFTEKMAAPCDWLAGPPGEERRIIDAEIAKLRQVDIEVRRQLRSADVNRPYRKALGGSYGSYCLPLR